MSVPKWNVNLLTPILNVQQLGYLKCKVSWCLWCVKHWLFSSFVGGFLDYGCSTSWEWRADKSHVMLPGLPFPFCQCQIEHLVCGNSFWHSYEFSLPFLFFHCQTEHLLHCCIFMNFVEYYLTDKFDMIFIHFVPAVSIFTFVFFALSSWALPLNWLVIAVSLIHQYFFTARLTI